MICSSRHRISQGILLPPLICADGPPVQVDERPRQQRPAPTTPRTTSSATSAGDVCRRGEVRAASVVTRHPPRSAAGGAGREHPIAPCYPQRHDGRAHPAASRVPHRRHRPPQGPSRRRAPAQARHGRAGSDLNIVVLDAEHDRGRGRSSTRPSAPASRSGPGCCSSSTATSGRPRRGRRWWRTCRTPCRTRASPSRRETLAASDALYKAVKKLGGVLRFDLPKKYEMAGVGEGARQGAPPAARATAVAKHLLDRCGNDPGTAERLEREIEKLALYCRGEEATEADVDAICTPDDDAVIFDLMDAVGHRDRSAQLRAARGPLRLRQPAGTTPTACSTASSGTSRSSTRRHSCRTPTRRRPRSSWACTPSRPRSCWSSASTSTGAAWAAPTGRSPRPRPGCAAGRRSTLESVGGVNDGDRLVVELALARLLT